MLEFIVFVIIIILGLIYIKNRFLRMIFICILGLTFYFIIFVLRGGLESGLEYSKSDSIYITTNKNETVCFYIDTNHDINNYILIGAYVSENNTSETVWDFDAYDVVNNKLYVPISVNSFSKKEHCIAYGTDIKGTKVNVKKVLKPNIEYVVHFDTTIKDTDYTKNHISFTGSFKLHKNQSTGKTEVEIVNN